MSILLLLTVLKLQANNNFSFDSKKPIHLILAKTKLKSVILNNTFIVAKNLNFVNTCLILDKN